MGVQVVHEVAPKEVSECILSLPASSEAEVDSLVSRVRAAGGEIAAGPERESWGYSATFKDLDGHVWMAVHSL
ncbi:VOC family protein [Saccharospirillum sp. HFRX-1]|uniref:VOC family protein n=1 Tax=Saccharospirillum sp. HFRX-1 TaxID=3157713 RepID=UPI0037246695